MHPLIPLSAVAAAFLLLRRDPSSETSCPPCEMEPAIGYAYALNQNTPSPSVPAIGKPIEVVGFAFSGERLGGAPLIVSPVGKDVDTTMPNGQPGRVMMAQIAGSKNFILLYFFTVPK